ncbi:MAG: transporter substrate-binding domain-containing protein [Rhodobacteraceae bacterium]|nr:transporter substrate-binding domain-containing protein [Paracoccaceae bacterium]
MRRTTSVLAAVALATGLGFGAANAEVFKVALDGTFAPHAMPTLSGGVEGFNVDLANALGEKMGRKMEITAAQWSGLLPGMQAGTYDFLVAPTTVTEERSKNLLFSEGYLNTDFQFAVKSGAPEVADLSGFSGKTIAVNKGSAYDKWARELEGEIGWTVESYGTATDAIQAVVSGRAFATVAGNTVIAWAVKKNSGLALSYLHDTGKVFAIPFRKDDTETRILVESALECLKLDGTIAKLSEKWFGYAPAEGSAAATVFPGFGVPGLEGHDPAEHTPDC